MDHRRALGGILGLVVALSASAGLELSAAEVPMTGKRWSINLMFAESRHLARVPPTSP